MKTSMPALLLLGGAVFLCPTPCAAQSPCAGDSYAFVVYSDDYMTGTSSGFDLQILRNMFGLDPNIRMIFAAGDVTPVRDARSAIDARMASHLSCGEPEFPFFPAMGNHSYDQDSSIAWFTSTYTNDWTDAPQASRLAKQLPGATNFRRGPLAVLTPSASSSIWNGTIYSFDFKNAHFVVLNNFEQAGAPQPDSNYGVWDVNGPNVSDPSNSQLDWLSDDLARTTQPLKFIFSHVGNVAAWYAMDGSMTAGCGQWSEHQSSSQSDPNSPFHTRELAALLAQQTGVTIFRGHDHCPSRQLVDASNLKVFERSYWDAYRDTQRPFGDPSLWQNLMGPGRFWQVDDGSAYNNMGFFTLARVNPYFVTFETYRWDQSAGPLTLWDSFTVPVPDAPPDTEAPSVPANVGGAAVSPTQITVTWDRATDNAGVTGYNVYRGGQLIGTVATTYFKDGGLAPSTSYAYEVEAFDRAGNISGRSAPVLLTTMLPDYVPPTVEITAPPSGASVSGMVTVSANAFDDVRLTGVQFLLDGSALGSEDTTAPFSASWATRSWPNAAYTLTAVARDAAGNTTASAPVSVTTVNDFTPPVLSAVTATTATSSAAVSWTTDKPSNTQVQYGTTTAYGSQTSLNTAMLTAHAATITGLRVGIVYHYRARSADALGNLGLSADMTVLIPDTQAPTTPPSFTATVASPIRINLAWGASTDNVAITGYRLYRNGVLISTRTSRSFADSALQPNTVYSYAVEAYDAAGNTSGQATVSAATLADTTAPTVTLSAPRNGATVSGASVTISASASDNVAVAGVQFAVDGTSVGAEDTAAPYSISWSSTAVANGTHAITAVARDSSGNASTSSARSVIVRN
jgi:chitodextrinase